MSRRGPVARGLRAWGLLLLLALLAGLARADALDRIRARGVLVAGMKTDYPPFGMLDAQGRPQGLEHDLAADLARRLGVRLEVTGVTSANRLQKLETGTVDLLIATLGDTVERRQVAAIIEPNYYASSVTLMMRPQARVTDWQGIRGQSVCAIHGAYFNRPMAERYLLQLLNFPDGREARLALRDGRCIGYLFDDTAIWADLRRPEFAGYQAPLPPVLPAPWAIALHRDERGGPLERLVSDAVADWHRSGWLLEREKAWGLPPSPFLASAHALWSQRRADGAALCARDALGQWPAACRNPAFLTPRDVDGLYRIGMELRERTGWDLSYLYDRYDRSRVLRGLAQSVALMAACVAASLALGLGAALLAESGRAWMGRLVRAWAAWSRMTPPLLQMYLVFFGLGSLPWDDRRVHLPALGVAVACLGAYTGASVMAALLDACALRREAQPGFRLAWRSLPQVYGPAAGSITASLANVCKATMMASVITVPELLSAATGILAERGNVQEVMNMLLLAFLLLVGAAVAVLRRLEAWLREHSERAP